MTRITDAHAQVDDDDNGTVSFGEWISFWENVISQPDYKDNEVIRFQPKLEQELGPELGLVSGLGLGCRC